MVVGLNVLSVSSAAEKSPETCKLTTNSSVSDFWKGAETRLGWILTYGWNNKDLAGQETLVEALGVVRCLKILFLLLNPGLFLAFLSHLHPH